MTKRLLHFSVGPVQGFIADARRVRDLWAGSFLLSWLSGHAMAALGEKGERIIFPEIEQDELFEAILKKNKSAPYIGSLPNRFKADVTGIADAGEFSRDRFTKKWNDLASAVWTQFIAPEANAETEKIWNRQVVNFWDITWVEGDDPDDNSDATWLDKRKNWRSHFLGAEGTEGGDLCRLMGQYQEISGYHRISGKDKQCEFYSALREQKYTHPSTGEKRRLGELNIGRGEPLCAIALIKRLFPLLDNIEDVIGWRPGWPQDAAHLNVINWPSVSYIAAVPWLKAIKPSLGENYVKIAQGNIREGFKGETETTLFGLPRSDFYKLDGHLLHQDGVRAWEKDGLKGDVDDQKMVARKEVLSGLRVLQKDVGDAASEFYAVLLMDGDQIGAKIAEYHNIVKVGLAEFTRSVKRYFDPNEVEKNPANGVLIYAGGDDVLAFLPVDTAIEAAKQMRAAYASAFEAAASQHNGCKLTAKDFSMSGAIVFAQYKIPLRSVLENAHSYLDKIAKEKNGRDSLAIAVMKPGGIAFDWASCWKGAVDPVTAMEDIAKDRSAYSSGFFYNVRQRYAPLFQIDGLTRCDREVERVFADADFMKSVLRAEYLKQHDDEDHRTRADSAVEQLMRIGKPLIRKRGAQVQPCDNYSFDSALIARFLSEEGRWKSALSSNPDEEQK